jgi:transcriptional regulator with XRE-family HTH domain
MEDMSLRENFRENLRRRRKELGLTQQDVATRMSIARPQVAQAEAGQNSPTLDMVERYAKALECPALTLLVANEEAFSVA